MTWYWLVGIVTIILFALFWACLVAGKRADIMTEDIEKGGGK